MFDGNKFIIVFHYSLVLPKNESDEKQEQGWQIAVFLFKLTEQEVIVNSES